MRHDGQLFLFFHPFSRFLSFRALTFPLPPSGSTSPWSILLPPSHSTFLPWALLAFLPFLASFPPSRTKATYLGFFSLTYCYHRHADPRSPDTKRDKRRRESAGPFNLDLRRRAVVRPIDFSNRTGALGLFVKNIRRRRRVRFAPSRNRSLFSLSLFFSPPLSLVNSVYRERETVEG